MPEPQALNGLTSKQKTQMEALESMPNEDIDLSDIPEVSDSSDAIYGANYGLQAGKQPPRK